MDSARQAIENRRKLKGQQPKDKPLQSPTSSAADLADLANQIYALDQSQQEKLSQLRGEIRDKDFSSDPDAAGLRTALRQLESTGRHGNFTPHFNDGVDPWPRAYALLDELQAKKAQVEALLKDAEEAEEDVDWDDDTQAEAWQAIEQKWIDAREEFDRMLGQLDFSPEGGGEYGNDIEPSIEQKREWLDEYKQFCDDGGTNREDYAFRVRSLLQPNLEKLLDAAGIPLFW